MARRDDHHRHNQLHYVSILPSNPNINYQQNDPRVARRPSEQDRTKALYVDFEDAFQDETANNDYFGLQSSEQNCQPLANLHLQTVETISEVQNTNISPHIRYQASRETSHSSTPSDTPPYQPRYNHRLNHLPSSSNGQTNLNRDFTNLNIVHTNDNNNNEIPAPFTPDALRLKVKQQEITPNSSSQSKLNLPQYFLVKYLGRTACTQLWGSKAVRTPIDDMVRNARQLSSMSEVPTLEVSINTLGLTLTHRHSPTRNKHHRNHSPERHQHGLIPLDNISYAMHDVKYSKVASCIVLRQLKTPTNDHKIVTETLTECYAFLFQTKDHAHRFALALAEAFNVQKQPTRNSRANHDEKREGRSPQRRSKHRNGHHQHQKTHNGGKSNENHLRDSEV